MFSYMEPMHTHLESLTCSPKPGVESLVNKVSLRYTVLAKITILCTYLSLASRKDIKEASTIYSLIIPLYRYRKRRVIEVT